MNEFHAILVVVNYFFNLLNRSMKKKICIGNQNVDVKSAGKLSLHVHLLVSKIFCEENPVAFIVH